MKKKLMQLLQDASIEDPAGNNYEHRVIADSDFGDLADAILRLFNEENTEGAQLIAKERQRQIEVEGYTPEHDDQHTDEELADAGAVYALSDGNMHYIDVMLGNDMYLMLWPFDTDYLKKDDTGNTQARIKDLTKAGALIAAEIDRLTRLEESK